MIDAEDSSKDCMMAEKENKELEIEAAKLEIEARKLEIKKKKQENEMARSKVRRCVTYASIYGYLILAGLVVLYLMQAGRFEIAIGVLGGIAGLAGSISGYWFGSRRPKSSEIQEKEEQNE